jgi:hypothetical protein
MNTTILRLLEWFYDRHQPLGVAFTGSGRFQAAIGRPIDHTTYEAASSNAGEGFSQSHMEHSGVSIYSSYFGWGKRLVAIFPFQEQYPPPAGPWLAFVRLAVFVQRYLENPDESDELPPSAWVPAIPRHPTPLRSLRAEAPLEDTE